MWLMLPDAFLSIVEKDCPKGKLLVRARRPNDIRRVFGSRYRVERHEDADYLYRAVIPRAEVKAALGRSVNAINYSNFKNTVSEEDLHCAYLKVWTAMAGTQNPPPYSKPHRPGAKR